MANAIIQQGHLTQAEFDANPSLVLEDGQIAWLKDNSGKFKKGDGITILSALPFLGSSNVAEDGLLTGGTITIVGNDIQVSAASWLINPTIYSTISTTTFSAIALSSTGLQRYIGLYGTTSNTITKVEGSEAALATYPTTPANTIVIGYVLVNDASASSTPDLSGYLLKLDKATQSTNTTGTNDTTYVTPLANAIKLNKNTAITGATKTKITYDSKGLVTSGADATTADIADSTNKRYVTDANLTVIGNTSGTNSGDNATNSQYSGLAASKQDTLVSGTNIKTINSNSLVGSGNQDVSLGGVGVAQNKSGFYIPIQTLNLGQTAGNINITTARYYKFTPIKDITISGLSFYLGGGTASSNAIFSIFEVSSSELFSTHIGYTASIPCTSSGIKTGSLSVTLSATKSYFIVLQTDNTTINFSMANYFIGNIYAQSGTLGLYAGGTCNANLFSTPTTIPTHTAYRADSTYEPLIYIKTV